MANLKRNDSGQSRYNFGIFLYVLRKMREGFPYTSFRAVCTPNHTADYDFLLEHIGSRVLNISFNVREDFLKDF